MSEKDLLKMQKDLADLQRLMHGDPTTRKGGTAQFVETLGTAVFGNHPVSGGLVADVMALKRIMYIGYGVMITLQVVLQIVFHFWKP